MLAGDFRHTLPVVLGRVKMKNHKREHQYFPLYFQYRFLRITGKMRLAALRVDRDVDEVTLISPDSLLNVFEGRIHGSNRL